LVDGHDRPVPELGGAAGLAKEAVPVLGGVPFAGAGQLQGHDPVQLRVAGLPHRPVRALAELAEDLEPAELPAIRPPTGGGVADIDGRTARRADDLARGLVLDELDRPVAVRTADVVAARAGVDRRPGRWRLEEAVSPLMASEQALDVGPQRRIVPTGTV